MFDIQRKIYLLKITIRKRAHTRTLHCDEYRSINMMDLVVVDFVFRKSLMPCAPYFYDDTPLIPVALKQPLYNTSLC